MNTRYRASVMIRLVFRHHIFLKVLQVINVLKFITHFMFLSFIIVSYEYQNLISSLTLF